MQHVQENIYQFMSGDTESMQSAGHCMMHVNLQLSIYATIQQ